MKKYIAYTLFFASYSPLFFYIWVIKNDYPDSLSTLYSIQPNQYDIFLLFSFVFLLIFYLTIRSIKKTAPFTYNIKKIDLKNTEFLSYIMTSFFALLSLNINWTKELIWGLLLLFFIAYVYVLSDQLYTNPVFAVFWYSIYEAITENDDHIMVISRNKSLKGANIPLIKLTQKIYFSNN